MNIIEFRDFYRSELEKTNKESDYIFKILLKELCNIDPLKIALDPSFIVRPKYEMLLKASLKNILRNYPLDYIINKKSFFGYDFYVDENVLIPRPETEELVQWVIDDNNTNDRKKLIDLGAGSGCIGISISKTISFDVTLADISKESLRVCNINKDILEANVKIIEYDMNTEFTNDEFFDIIVSNPPYLSFDDPNILSDGLRHEPLKALAAENHGIKDIEEIIANSAKLLADKGSLYIEFGNDQSRKVVSLFKKNGYSEINLYKDLNGDERFCSGKITKC